MATKDNINYKIPNNAFSKECAVEKMKCVTLYDADGNSYIFRADKAEDQTISVKVGGVVAVISTENGKLLDIKGAA